MSAPTKTPAEAPLIACQKQLDRFFAAYPNPELNKRAAKALRLLATVEKPFAGKPESLAAGVIYAVANLERFPCGVPGVFNSEFAGFFGVSMGAIRRRAGRIMSAISI